jgi:hypothetical protein
MYKTKLENFPKILKCIEIELIFVYVPPLLTFEDKFSELGYSVLSLAKHSKKYISNMIKCNPHKILIYGFPDVNELDEIFMENSYTIVYYFPNDKQYYLSCIKKNLSDLDKFKLDIPIKNQKNETKLTLILYEYQKKIYEKLINEKKVLVFLL